MNRKLPADGLELVPTAGKLTEAEKAALFGDLNTWIQGTPTPKTEDEAKLARAD